MLTGIGQDYYGGGVALLKVSPSFDKEQFAQKIKADGVPTLQQEKGRYYFYTLQESYFQHYTQESIPYIARSQQLLLLIGLISALLILLIACSNYINLSFSRILQQIRIIHTQKLMGATQAEMNYQLFLDTFLTVGIAFLLSLLIAHDLIPVFNRIMSGRITTGFFLNRQVLPVICGLILIMSIIPACYMSRKIANLTDSNYRLFFTGNKKSPFHHWKRPVFPCSPRQDPCRYRSRPTATVHGRYSGSAPGFRPSRCQWHMKEAGLRALRRRVRSRFSRDSLLTPAGSGDHGRATLGRELRLVNVWWTEGGVPDRSRQGLPPRSPDMLYPSEKSALEREWGEFEGEGGILGSRTRFPPSPPHHKQALRSASPDAR